MAVLLTSEMDSHRRIGGIIVLNVSYAAIFKPADFLVKFFGGFFIEIPNLEKLTVRGILGLVIKKM